MKYAVKVPMPEDDWLFVTREGPDGPEVVLYDSREEAEKQAKIWNSNAEVVEYTSHSTVALKEDENGDLILPLPEHLLSQLGWTEGTQLEWIDNENGTFSLAKKDD